MKAVDFANLAEDLRNLALVERDVGLASRLNQVRKMVMDRHGLMPGKGEEDGS